MIKVIYAHEAELTDKEEILALRIGNFAFGGIHLRAYILITEELSFQAGKKSVRFSHTLCRDLVETNPKTGLTLVEDKRILENSDFAYYEGLGEQLVERMINAMERCCYWTDIDDENARFVLDVLDDEKYEIV